MSNSDVLVRFFDTMYQRYIPPEIERRRAEGNLPADFAIMTCLIRLPKDQTPIIEFNGEFGWEVKSPKLAPGVVMEAGHLVLLRDVDKVGDVIPPTCNGCRVAFLFFYWNGRGYEYVYDASPDLPGFDPKVDVFPAGKVIARYLQFYLIQVTIRNSEIIQQELREIGLWPVPALLPYPMAKIADFVNS